ncbi:hypothetical protein FB45DRAFT_1020219 [Roridomyces roridus]|uniref:TPR-like protein n=1 Tax=Roridomyces roridus TaxID=1738132 RepID=A0AAD7G0Q1_9AGAR|nr:hypothetical protein FB45DRAFT_1020219 [Roridomyces roridus]
MAKVLLLPLKPNCRLTGAVERDSDSGMNSDFEEDDVKPQILVKSEGADVEPTDEFERLVQDIKLNESTSNAGLLSKDWDFSIEDTGAFRPGGVRFRPRRGVKLSFQTETLIGAGNQAYVNGDLATATKTMLEVLRIEPRAAAAWTVLAKCYEDRNEVGKALQMRIMGAHLKADAEEWDSLARQSKELGHHQQALYCWSKVQSIDPSNVAALWDRAMLSKEIGDIKTTRNAILGILDRFPHDLNILTEIRTVLVDLSELETCKTLFQGAFTHYHNKFPSGVGPAADTGVDAPAAGFGLLEILVLADLYNTLGEHERAVDVTRKGVRWLQGRSAETYWDECTDDREFDYDDVERAVEEESDDLEPGYYELDVNARHRLAIARIRMGDEAEAKVHTDIVLSQDLMDYSPLFVEIADAYFDRELWAEARAVYEILGANETTSSVDILIKTAACLRNMDELQDAAEIYETVRKADPTENDVKMRLAEIYEVLNEPRKALDLVLEVMDSRYGRRTRKCKTDAPVDEPTEMQTDNAPLIQDKALRSGIKRVTSNAQYRLSNAEVHKMESEREKAALEC